MPADARQSAIARPHGVTLKVLRLTRPSQELIDPWISIPNRPSSTAALAYPSQKRDGLPLTPLLTLPPSFGAAYVGETFSCTLCASNALAASELGHATVSDVRIDAELQSPKTAPKVSVLALRQADGAHANGESAPLLPDKSLQGAVEQELVEEGTHVLAVTVTYTDSGAGDADEPAIRTFRKLYQFVAQRALRVKTKITALKGKDGERHGAFVLEAQIENVSDQVVFVDSMELELTENLKDGTDGGADRVGSLAPQDIAQVAFVIVRVDGGTLSEQDGKLVVARLSVRWLMGSSHGGIHRTGWLGHRFRASTV